MKYFAYLLIPLLCLIAVLYLVLQSFQLREARDKSIRQSQSITREYLIEFDYLVRPLIANNAYMAGSHALSDFLDEPGRRSVVLEDFALLAKTHPVFQQVRLLDTLGQEMLRVDYDDDGVQIVEEMELQSKSERDYFLKAKLLKPNQVYVTSIDLNMEHHRVEKPYNPVLRIISPVSKAGGIRTGYLVYNVSVEKLIELIDVLNSKAYAQVVLINNRGEALVYEGEAIEYYYPSTSLGAYSEAFPAIWDSVSKASNGYLILNNQFVTWDRFGLENSTKAFYDNLKYLNTEASSFKILAFVAADHEEMFFQLTNVNKVLVLGLILTFLVLAINFAWGRLQMDKRHYLISELNDELIKSQANLNREKFSLKKVVHELTFKNNQLSEFSQIISHNIRAPLSSLTLLVQYLSIHFEDLSTSGKKEALDNLQVLTTALNELANDLWATVKVLDNTNVQMEKVNLQSMVDGLKEKFNSRINEANVDLKTEFEWIFVVHNERYLEAILTNLIDNAIKYRAPDRKPKVEVFTETFQGKKVLRLKDNGRGMNLDWHSNNVFGMHQRFHSDVSGRGMGLFMVKMQVEALGGNIFVESEENRGSTFTIMF